MQANESGALLKKQLQLKEMQMEALLEATQAINNNVSAADLFRIFSFTILGQGVSQIALYHKNTSWDLVLHFAVTKEQLEHLSVEDTLLPLGSDVHSLQPKSLGENLPFEWFIPVYHKQEPLAMLLLGSLKKTPDEPDTAGREQLRFIQTFTNIIIVAIENKRLFRQKLEQESIKKELEVAERVQNMLVPKRLPKNKRVDMEAVYMPHHNIGGDYYDYIALDENRFMVCMADISGKGIAAALLMANVQAILRTIARETPNLADLIVRLNQRLWEVTAGDPFISLFVAIHDFSDNSIAYINAGHNPPLMIFDNTVQLLKKGCPILGAFDKIPGPTPEPEILHWKPNTVFLTYTDGLTDLENDNGQSFTIETLSHFALQHFDLSMLDFNVALLQTIKQFKGKQNYNDDISILSYRVF